MFFMHACHLLRELLATKRDSDLPKRQRELGESIFLPPDDLGCLLQKVEES